MSTLPEILKKFGDISEGKFILKRGVTDEIIKTIIPKLLKAVKDSIRVLAASSRSKSLIATIEDRFEISKYTNLMTYIKKELRDFIKVNRYLKGRGNYPDYTMKERYEDVIELGTLLLQKSHPNLIKEVTKWNNSMNERLAHAVSQNVANKRYDMPGFTSEEAKKATEVEQKRQDDVTKSMEKIVKPPLPSPPPSRDSMEPRYRGRSINLDAELERLKETEDPVVEESVVKRVEKPVVEKSATVEKPVVEEPMEREDSGASDPNSRFNEILREREELRKKMQRGGGELTMEQLAERAAQKDQTPMTPPKRTTPIDPNAPKKISRTEPDAKTPKVGEIWKSRSYSISRVKIVNVSDGIVTVAVLTESLTETIDFDVTIFLRDFFYEEPKKDCQPGVNGNGECEENNNLEINDSASSASDTDYGSISSEDSEGNSDFDDSDDDSDINNSNIIDGQAQQQAPTTVKTPVGRDEVEEAAKIMSSLNLNTEQESTQQEEYRDINKAITFTAVTLGGAAIDLTILKNNDAGPGYIKEVIDKFFTKDDEVKWGKGNFLYTTKRNYMQLYNPSFRSFVKEYLIYLDDYSDKFDFYTDSLTAAQEYFGCRESVRSFDSFFEPLVQYFVDLAQQQRWYTLSAAELVLPTRQKLDVLQSKLDNSVYGRSENSRLIAKLKKKYDVLADETLEDGGEQRDEKFADKLSDCRNVISIEGDYMNNAASLVGGAEDGNRHSSGETIIPFGLSAIDVEKSFPREWKQMLASGIKPEQIVYDAQALYLKKKMADNKRALNKKKLKELRAKKQKKKDMSAPTTPVKPRNQENIRRANAANAAEQRKKKEDKLQLQRMQKAEKVKRDLQQQLEEAERQRKEDEEKLIQEQEQQRAELAKKQEQDKIMQQKLEAQQQQAIEDAEAKRQEQKEQAEQKQKEIEEQQKLEQIERMMGTDDRNVRAPSITKFNEALIPSYQLIREDKWPDAGETAKNNINSFSSLLKEKNDLINRILKVVDELTLDSSKRTVRQELLRYYKKDLNTIKMYFKLVLTNSENGFVIQFCSEIDERLKNKTQNTENDLTAAGGNTRKEIEILKAHKTWLEVRKVDLGLILREVDQDIRKVIGNTNFADNMKIVINKVQRMIENTNKRLQLLAKLQVVEKKIDNAQIEVNKDETELETLQKQLNKANNDIEAATRSIIQLEGEDESSDADISRLNAKLTNLKNSQRALIIRVDDKKAEKKTQEEELNKEIEDKRQLQEQQQRQAEELENMVDNNNSGYITPTLESDDDGDNESSEEEDNEFYSVFEGSGGEEESDAGSVIDSGGPLVISDEEIDDPNLVLRIIKDQEEKTAAKQREALAKEEREAELAEQQAEVAEARRKEEEARLNALKEQQDVEKLESKVNKPKPTDFTELTREAAKKFVEKYNLYDEFVTPDVNERVREWFNDGSVDENLHYDASLFYSADERGNFKYIVVACKEGPPAIVETLHKKTKRAKEVTDDNSMELIEVHNLTGKYGKRVSIRPFLSKVLEKYQKLGIKWVLISPLTDGEKLNTLAGQRGYDLDKMTTDGLIETYKKWGMKLIEYKKKSNKRDEYTHRDADHDEKGDVFMIGEISKLINELNRFKDAPKKAVQNLGQPMGDGDPTDYDDLKLAEKVTSKRETEFLSGEMKYKDIQKYAKLLGVNGKGKKKDIAERIAKKIGKEPKIPYKFFDSGDEMEEVMTIPMFSTFPASREHFEAYETQGLGLKL